MGSIEFYVIYNWMRDELELAGTELDCYAVIYSLSQSDNRYIAGVKRLMELLHKSEPTIIAALKALTEKGLIIKEPVMVNNIKRYYYKGKRPSKNNQEPKEKKEEKAENGTTLNNLSNPLKSTEETTLNDLSSINNINNKENKKKKELSSDNSKKTKEGSLFTEVIDEKEKNYLEHMHEHYPLIMKMDKPLTYKEFNTLRDNYDVDLVWDKMDNLENTKNMRKKYVSAYLTLNKWCKMDFNREPKKKEDEQ